MSLEAFKMYYAMRASAPSLHRESTDSLILSGLPFLWDLGHWILFLLGQSVK